MFEQTSAFHDTIIRFKGLFSKSVFQLIEHLALGAILCTGKRTVSAILRILGFSQLGQFHKYHRVLSRACWSALQASRILLLMILEKFLPQGPVLIGLDETIERRWGSKISKRGIYRDPVRSSRSFFVKCSGLRWICAMVLVKLPWCAKTWALPFLSVLAPSEKYAKNNGLRHKKISDWARQILLQISRWLKGRKVIAVGDSSYAVIELLAAVKQYVTMITRFRVDAALYEKAQVPPKGKRGRKPKKGARLPTLEQIAKQSSTKWQKLVFSQWYGKTNKEMEITSGVATWYHSGMDPVEIRWVLLRDPEGKHDLAAILSTDIDLSPEVIVQYFVARWAVEVTFQQVRAHLGVETQRQWSDKAIDRSTPALMALFSIVCLIGDNIFQHQNINIQQSAWYKKQNPTFSDIIASVRIYLWKNTNFSMSDNNLDSEKLNPALVNIIIQNIAWAA